MGDKEVKMKLWQLQEQISLLVCADLLANILASKLTPYSKMNVRLADQVLSSVSKVLLAYSSPEAEEKTRFCSLMD